MEMTGWFKQYFPGNLRRNFLFTVCNYTSYQNLQKNSLPNPFAREKAGDKAGTVAENTVNVSAYRWFKHQYSGTFIELHVQLQNEKIKISIFRIKNTHRAREVKFYQNLYIKKVFTNRTRYMNWKC